MMLSGLFPGFALGYYTPSFANAASYLSKIRRDLSTNNFAGKNISVSDMDRQNILHSLYALQTLL